MKRKMITGEQLMYVDAATPLNCVFTVKIRGSFSPVRLKKALSKVQHKHPLLRSVIKEDHKGVPYLVSSNSLTEIPVRIVDRRSDDDWKTESKTEWGKLFKEKQAPLIRVVWLWSAEVSELLLVCPHCICDGRSMVTLMNELLLVLDDPAKKLESYLPFNSIQELLSESYSLTKKIRTKVMSLIASWFFFSKFKPDHSAAGSSYMLSWKLDAESVAGLLDNCKKKEVTVHAFLCVAFLEAFRSVKGKEAKGRAVTPVDIRRFVPEIREDMMFAMAPTIEVGLDQHKGLDFWTKTEKLGEELITKIAGLDGRESLLMGEYFQAPKIINYLKSTEGTHDVTLSNMGRLGIAETYRSFEVETICSPNVAFPWKNPNTLIVSTFKGEMDFAFCSNDAFLSQEDAEAIRVKTTEIISQEVNAGYVAV